MVSNNKPNTDLPKTAIEYIDAVIKKMRYRKKIRAEVRSELIAHFEDALRNCEDELRQERCKELIKEFGDVKLLGVLLRRGKKRCRAWWRTAIVRVFQGIGILFLGLIMYCMYISFAQPNIRVDYIAEMTNVNRPVADENLNAAVMYQKAIDNYVEPPKIDRETESIGNEQIQTEEVDLLTAIDDKKWIAELTDEEVTLLKQWVADNDKAIEYFMAGSQRPHCWWERKVDEWMGEKWILGVLLPELRPMKNMVKLICWRAKLKASEGEIEDSFDDLLKCYKAGEHLKGPRTLIEQLVGIAMQAIAVHNSRMILDNADVDSERLKALQEEFEDMRASGTYVTSYETERFFLSDFLQRIYTDNGKGGGRMIPRGGLLWEMLESDIVSGSGLDFESVGSYAASLGISLVSANRREMTVEVEKVFQTAQRWATMTPWQLRNSDEDLSLELETWSWIKEYRYWPVSVFMPALKKVCEISYRNMAEVDALIATIAILRYEKEKGEYPESLDSLVADGYLKQLPMDPYSNKSLVYSRKDDGFILYSFGTNYADDGGEYDTNRSGNFRRWRENGDRVFWPVWKDEN